MHDFTYEHTDDDGDQIYVRGSEAEATLLASIYGENGGVILRYQEAKELHAMLGAFIEHFQPRSYVVGLPVVVTVNPDGTVEYDVDTSEAASAISEVEHDEQAQDVWGDDFDADVRAVSLDHQRRHNL